MVHNEIVITQKGYEERLNVDDRIAREQKEKDNYDKSPYCPVIKMEPVTSEACSDILDTRPIHENVPQLREIVKRVPLREDASELNRKIIDSLTNMMDMPSLMYRMGYMDGASDAIHNVENGDVYIDEKLRKYNLELKNNEKL
jgi:hypothetical protein|nr:MAG TPA: hypothetical protein [Caudoviricetes sp.]